MRRLYYEIDTHQSAFGSKYTPLQECHAKYEAASLAGTDDSRLVRDL